MSATALTDNPNRSGYEVVRFGPFTLREHGEALFRDEEAVRIGSRARQILNVLTSRPGEVVSKSELMAAVWPDTMVVESNVTVHVTALRQALGDGRDGGRYIINIPGRGYRFVAPVRREQDRAETSAPAGLAHLNPTNLPFHLTPAIGRAETIRSVLTRLGHSKLLTLTGPAGVGKTTVALHVAETVLSRFADGVWFVDIAPLREAAHLAPAVAATMRTDLGSDDPVGALAFELSQRKVLVVLDNCEHLIDAVANLTSTILRACPEVVLIATSREALRVSGEAVFTLAPLDTPPPQAGTREMLDYSAVQLFLDRARAAMSAFELSDLDTRAIASICRRLDGLPLAIEFAAPLLEAFGITGLAERLDERFRLIQVSRRGVSERHQTLTTALEWSYGLLDVQEQTVLRRLAVFAGGFSLEGAAAAVGMGDLSDIADLLARLHAKSLVTSDPSPRDIRFGLLETTRAFALEKLEQAQEARQARLRHASFYCKLLKHGRLHLGERAIAEDAIELDNIRAALRYTIAPDGDLGMALSLASGALPVWLGLSLVSECRARLREIMALLPPEQLESSEGWDLEIALRVAEMFTTGVTPNTFARWPAASADLVSEAHTQRALIGDTLTRFVWYQRNGYAAEATEFRGRHRRLTENTGLAYDQAARAWAAALHGFVTGDLLTAKTQFRAVLDLETPEFRRIFIGRTGYDRTTSVQTRIGAVISLMGEFETGIEQARSAETEAKANGKSLSTCEAMLWKHFALEIAQRDYAGLESDLDELAEVSRVHGLQSHLGGALGLKGILCERHGRYAEAEGLLRQGVDYLRRAGVEEASPWFHAVLAASIGRDGRVDEGFAVAGAWQARDRNPGGWCAAEFHRALGNLHQLKGDLDAAIDEYAKAIHIATGQGAQAWVDRANRDLAIAAQLKTTS